jgi:RNA polymerase sigma-70 factor (ECF subfamily)
LYNPIVEEDKDLVRWAVKGDQDAFGKLYEENIDKIYKFVAASVSDRQTAEDITSKVFTKAWEKIGKYELRGAPFRAWLFRIARNTVIDHYRTSKEVTSLDVFEDVPNKTELPVLDKVKLVIEVDEIMKLIKELTPAQQEVLVLRLVNELTTAETSQILGKGEGAVRALQMRGLQALGRLMEERAPKAEYLMVK